MSALEAGIATQKRPAEVEVDGQGEAHNKAARFTSAGPASQSGVLRRLFVKPPRAKGEPKGDVQAREQLALASCAGIEGGGERGLSPRQLLLCGAVNLQALGCAEGCLRENAVLEGVDVMRVASGSTLTIGGAVVLRAAFHCEPCATGLGHVNRGRAAASLPALKGLKLLEPHRGLLCTVVKGGEISAGDAVTVKEGVYEPLPNDGAERLEWLMGKVPPDKLMTYTDVVERAGLSSQAARSIPGMLKRAREKRAGSASARKSHCVVSANGELQKESSFSEQPERLEAAGLKLSEQEVAQRKLAPGRLAQLRWAPTHEELFLRAAHT